MADNITHAEWLYELARLTAKNDDGMTVEEMMDATGRGEAWVRTRIRKASKLGWLRTGKRSAVNVVGDNYEANVYLFVKP